MVDTTKTSKTLSNEPQCQHFVTRKKRLCRMTVRPGRQYCGEHEPQPLSEDGKTDKRVPCPNDPKHTCYISKLEKHLAICNARQGELPPYIELNINGPAAVEECPRRPLSEIPRDTLMLLIDKINLLYDKHIEGNITTALDHPIHSAILEEFSESDRTESSLRHLRQASQLLWLVEDEGLVEDGTCYVELGAGKGQMSYYAASAWCGSGADSVVLVVDRAALRHKRDNRLRAGRALRLRADLRHLALRRVPAAAAAASTIGLAKHLCGVAMDYALRCLSGARCRGAVLATCCHHRCQRAQYVANNHLQELGISGEEFDTMLGVVSWATCGDGLSRERRKQLADANNAVDTEHGGAESSKDCIGSSASEKPVLSQEAPSKDSSMGDTVEKPVLSQDAPSNDNGIDSTAVKPVLSQKAPSKNNRKRNTVEKPVLSLEAPSKDNVIGSTEEKPVLSQETPSKNNAIGSTAEKPVLSQEERQRAGRRAKALVDWGRVLYLRAQGFHATLCYYVPSEVSLENVCIVAKKVAEL